jgi:hypothetical protein
MWCLKIVWADKSYRSNFFFLEYRKWQLGNMRKGRIILTSREKLLSWHFTNTTSSISVETYTIQSFRTSRYTVPTWNPCTRPLKPAIRLTDSLVVRFNTANTKAHHWILPWSSSSHQEHISLAYILMYHHPLLGLPSCRMHFLAPQPVKASYI